MAILGKMTLQDGFGIMDQNIVLVTLVLWEKLVFQLSLWKLYINIIFVKKHIVITIRKILRLRHLFHYIWSRVF